MVFCVLMRLGYTVPAIQNDDTLDATRVSSLDSRQVRIVSLMHTWPLTSYSLLLKRSPRGVLLPDRTEMQAASSVYKLILCRWAVAVKYFIYSA